MPQVADRCPLPRLPGFGHGSKSRSFPWGVFANEAICEIGALLADGVITWVQLPGAEDLAYIRELKACCPVPVIRALRVERLEDLVSGQQKDRPEDTCYWTVAPEEPACRFIGNCCEPVGRLYPIF